MLQSPSGTERLRSYLVLAATLGTIAFNWLAAAGRVNGVTPDVISARYPTIITPAAYAFSIWSLIYVGLIAFSIYQFLPANRERLRSVRSLYIFTCALSCGWIYFWHGDQIAVCFAIIVALAVTLFLINYQTQSQRPPAEFWFVKVPFEIYFGWVTAAALVNFAVLLRYLNVQMDEASTTVFGVILILLAASLAVFIRSRFSSYFYPLAIAWALTAIGVQQSGQTLVVSAAAIGVVACLIASLSFVMNLNSSARE